MKSVLSTRRASLLAVVLLATLASIPVHATEEGPVPGSCKLHSVHVVNPECVEDLTAPVLEPQTVFPNVSPDVREVGAVREVIFDPATGTFALGGHQLVFDSWVRNLGEVPLELVADDPENPTTAKQCVAWTSRLLCAQHSEVGDYVWHEEHRHFHFQDFADYQLRRLGPDGRPDYSDAGLLSRSEKVSFCLADTSLLDPLEPSVPRYVSCGPSLQGVSPGWADVYGTGTPGQALSLDGLGDGRYALVVSMDYAGRLYESDDTDNVIEVIIDVTSDMTQAVIVDKYHP